MNFFCPSLSKLFPVAPKDYVHRPNSLRTPAANQAIHVIYRFALLRVLHLYFCCRFLSASQRVSPGAPQLLSATGFAVYLLT